MLEHLLGLEEGTSSSRTCVTPPRMGVTPASLSGCGEPQRLPEGHSAHERASGDGRYTGTRSQPAPDWGSPTGLREYGPVRELHICWDRCHCRGGVRLHGHRADGQRRPQPAGTVLWGRGVACPRLGPSSQTPVPLPESTFPTAGLHCPLPGCPTVCAGHAGMPLATNMVHRRGALPGSRVLLPVTKDTSAKALGREGKQRPSSCLPCGSQCALDLKWCQRGYEHCCWRGTGPPQPVPRDEGQRRLRTASSSAVTLQRCQLCLMDNKCSATGSQAQRRGGGVAALPHWQHRGTACGAQLVCCRGGHASGSCPCLGPLTQGCPSAPRQAPGLITPWGWVFLLSSWDLPPCSLRLCPAPRDMENRPCPSSALLPLACLKTVPAASPQLAAPHGDGPAPPTSPRRALGLHTLPTPASWR